LEGKKKINVGTVKGDRGRMTKGSSAKTEWRKGRRKKI
jgi:hypothetical protein